MRPEHVGRDLIAADPYDDEYDENVCGFAGNVTHSIRAAVFASSPLERCNARTRCAPDKANVNAEPPMPATTFKAHKASI